MDKLSHFDASLCIASVAGVCSWLFLNRHTVRGDLALAFYTGAFCVLYTAARFLPAIGLEATPFKSASTIAATYFVTLASTTVAYRLSPWHPLASYPGPIVCRISSLWLTAVSLKGFRHVLFGKLHERYGPFVRLGPNVLSINTPSATALYQTMEKSESYRFPNHDDVIALFFKNSAENSKELHRERKRTWGPMFTTNSVADLAPVLEKRTWELLQALEKRQNREENKGYVDVIEAFWHWAHDFAADVVFGACNKFDMIKNGDPLEVVYTGKLAIVAQDSFGQSPWLFDILWYIPTTRDLHFLFKLGTEMAHTRINQKEPHTFRDLVSYLIDAGLREPDLARDAMVGILAGYDNTATMLSLACYFLTLYPTYLHQLRAELAAAFPGDPLGPMPFSALSALPLLNGIVNEILRLGSPYFLPRVVPEGGAVISGRSVPAGTIVALAAHSQQTSEENFYPEPLAFRPERWTPGGLGPDTKTNKAVLASFSYGPHACIGKALAYHEMRATLARLVLAYDMEFEPGFDPDAFYAGMMNMRTTMFARPLRMRYVRRAGVDLDPMFERISS